MSFRAQHQLQHPAPGELDYKVLEIDRAWSHVAASPPSQQALEEAEWQTVRGPRRSLPLPPDALVLDYKTRECRQHQYTENSAHPHPHDDMNHICLLYTSDAADEEDSVDLGGRRIIKKKKNGKCDGR
eukprot:TRINITY_DN5112_c0_g1_i10.p1 TRINITY_DN5112_c0_g1~~TRINITY_DN5112_c0_g1_i10.p1  ORF type:complete len:128 (-),score=30.64 TRINITY_DN5112_c0_g1_i10:56-439(-)